MMRLIIVLCSCILLVGGYLLIQDYLPSEPEPVVVSFSPKENLVALEQRLDESLELWLRQENRKAQALVKQVYLHEFEPMRKPLRQLRPLETLELEYSFGLLLSQMEKKTEEEAKKEMFRSLKERLRAGASLLPEPENPAAAEEKAEQGAEQENSLPAVVVE